MPPPNAIQKKGLYVTVTGIPDTVYYMEPSQGEIIQKTKMQELSSLFMTHRLSKMHALVKFHEYIPYGLRSNGTNTVYYMELNQGEIIKKKCKSCLPCS